MQLLNKMMTFRYTYLPTHMLYIILVRIHIREMRTVRDWEPDHVQANCWLYVNWRRKNVGLVCQKKNVLAKSYPKKFTLSCNSICTWSMPESYYTISTQCTIYFVLKVINYTYYIAQQFWVKTRWWWWYLITIYHSN